MKAPPLLVTAIALSVGISPCSAASPESPVPGKLIADSSTGSTDGAKGLFRKQLEQQDNKLNTGIQYWIELHRNGEILKANNKTVFQAGDDICFHITPNIDGYAYILLSSGSQGEKAVLFPDSQKSESNHVAHGEEIVLPGKASPLSFDKNPGIERVTLLVSRLPIDAQAYLVDPPGPKKDKPMLVAMNSFGSKDLVPSDTAVSYGEAPKALIKSVPSNTNLLVNNDLAVGYKGTHDFDPTTEGEKLKFRTTTTAANRHPGSSLIASKPATASSPAKPQTAHKAQTSQFKTVASATPVNNGHAALSSSHVRTTATPRTLIASAPDQASNYGAHDLEYSEPSKPISSNPNPNPSRGSIVMAPEANIGVVTIVRNNPEGVLAADIVLEHR